MDKPALICKPYRSPNVVIGDQLYCEKHGHDVSVAGFTAAPIPWPAYSGLTGLLTPILTGDLVRAVRTESAAAVAYWWGVSRSTVTRWRRSLDVGRFNEGTLRLWIVLSEVRLPQRARQKGAEAMSRKAKAGK